MGKLKALAVIVLCHPWVGRLLRVIFAGRIPSLRFRNWRIDTRSPAVSAHTAALIFWGVYESAELRFVESHLRRNLDVVECGGSLGGVSAAIAQRLDPERRLLCVEANPELVPLITSNVQTNAPGTRLTVVNRAIDYERTEVTFYPGDDSTGGRTTGATGNAGFSVPASKLSTLLDEQGVSEYVLVCDIEGAEVDIIERDAKALAGCRQILMELHAGEYFGNQASEAGLIANLQERHGFTLKQRHGRVVLLDREGSGSDRAIPAPV